MKHGGMMAKRGHGPEDERREPAEEALLHIHRTVLGRMGEQLAARMPKQEKKPDLPLNSDKPPATPAKDLVEKLKAIHARKG